MGLFILDDSKKPSIKSRVKTIIANLELSQKQLGDNYLIKQFALPYLRDVQESLRKLTNWHQIKPSQATIDKFWEEFEDASKHSQSKNSIFISAFQSALYEHLNDLNLIEDSSSDYELVEKTEHKR